MFKITLLIIALIIMENAGMENILNNSHGCVNSCLNSWSKFRSRTIHSQC
jgi:hypothetical protein